ncbi:MAG TPA: cytochrome c biogenesis protein CcdA [Thermomicrobiales bacterium]|nr:cytochrome c biogenesis protein CcdA [Thermomicrobiales bacterium]
MGASAASLSLLAAFGAGLLSFLSPCVVPLIPGYLAYLAGLSLQEARRSPAARGRVASQALWFVLGSGAVVLALGTTAVLLGDALSAYQEVLQRVGGLLLLIFGVALTGLVHVPWVSDEHRIALAPGRAAWWRSGLAGLTFGACWSACSGPILGAILVLTTIRSLTPIQGVLFVLAFAAGQGVPFLLAGLLVDRADAALRRIRPVTALVMRLGGVLLILLGAVLVTGLFSTAA